MSKAEKAAGLLALVLAVLHQVFLPATGTDLAAQLARASFAREAPLTPVDLSWYGGVHPFGYSLLSPWLMALLGVGLAGILAAVGGAVLFARLVSNLERPMAAALLGAFFAVADVVSGRITFALAAVALLAALLCRERRPWAIVFGVLTALLSPVAAAFLGFCAAVLVLHRRPGGWTLGLSASIPVVVMAVLFPGGGVQPFTAGSAVPAVVVALILAVLTTEKLVRTGAFLYALAILVFQHHADPFGSNVLRMGLLVAAALLVATVHRHSLLVVLAVVYFLSWQLDPLQGDLLADRAPDMRAVRQQLLDLDARRAEVLAPRDHRESWFVAEKVPLARGWMRQLDYRDNPLFYKGTLEPGEYLEWLQDHGVDHVVTAREARMDFGSRRETDLLTDPVPGLTRVWQDPEWAIYTVDGSKGLAPGAEVLRSTRTEIVLRSGTAGTVPVALRWSRWLTLSGPGCLGKAGDRVEVRFTGPGTVRLGSALRPRGHC